MAIIWTNWHLHYSIHFLFVESIQVDWFGLCKRCRPAKPLPDSGGHSAVHCSRVASNWPIQLHRYGLKITFTVSSRKSVQYNCWLFVSFNRNFNSAVLHTRFSLKHSNIKLHIILSVKIRKKRFLKLNKLKLILTRFQSTISGLNLRISPLWS